MFEELQLALIEPPGKKLAIGGSWIQGTACDKVGLGLGLGLSLGLILGFALI